MKKTDEALGKSQDQALIYRRQLEAGKIRLVPDRPSRPLKQKDEVEQQDETARSTESGIATG